MVLEARKPKEPKARLDKKGEIVPGKIEDKGMNVLMDLIKTHLEKEASEVVTTGTVHGITIGKRYKFTDVDVNHYGVYLGGGLSPSSFYPGDEIVVTGIRIGKDEHGPDKEKESPWAAVYYKGCENKRYVSMHTNTLSKSLIPSPGPLTAEDTYDKRKEVRQRAEWDKLPSTKTWNGGTIH